MKKTIKPYNMKHKFLIGDMINHKVLGNGEVIDKDKNRILVQFANQQKWLIYDYSA